MATKIVGKPAPAFDFNQEKFRNLILYVAGRSKDDVFFGAVKLNKILFYSDFYAYRKLGKPITGAKYQKLGEGPAPKQMVPVRRTMADSDQIDIEHRPYFSGVQQRIVPKTKPKMHLFSKDELAIVDEVIKFFWSKTAREVSDYSHREPGWKAAQPREVIPYETAWLSGDSIEQEAEEQILAKVGGGGQAAR